MFNFGCLCFRREHPHNCASKLSNNRICRINSNKSSYGATLYASDHLALLLVYACTYCHSALSSSSVIDQAVTGCKVLCHWSWKMSLASPVNRHMGAEKMIIKVILRRSLPSSDSEHSSRKWHSYCLPRPVLPLVPIDRSVGSSEVVAESFGIDQRLINRLLDVE